MNLKPLGDRVVVKPIREQQATESGIVLPDTATKEKPERGEVIAVGAGKTLENGQKAGMDVKVGDKVIFSKYGPSEIKVDDEELLIISESDIMAVIE